MSLRSVPLPQLEKPRSGDWGGRVDELRRNACFGHSAGHWRGFLHLIQQPATWPPFTITITSASSLCFLKLIFHSVT